MLGSSQTGWVSNHCQGEIKRVGAVLRSPSPSSPSSSGSSGSGRGLVLLVPPSEPSSSDVGRRRSWVVAGTGLSLHRQFSLSFTFFHFQTILLLFLFYFCVFYFFISFVCFSFYFLLFLNSFSLKGNYVPKVDKVTKTIKNIILDKNNNTS